MNCLGPRRRAANARVVATTWSATALACLLSASSAHAFELKHTASGQPVRWTSASVSFVVDSSIKAAARGGAAAVEAAVQAWSGASDGPLLSTTTGSGATRPEVDGKNTILFAPDGYAPAGEALAITITSYDANTGDLVDADVVVNGKHAFSVLPAGTQAPVGAVPISTEGMSGGADGSQVFDLQHVAAHEVGHALGLADESDSQAALMYPYTLPDDASVRAPEADDLSGVASLYAGTLSSGRGCSASVVGGRTHSCDGVAGICFCVGVAAWLASRRRARIVVPIAVAAVALVASTGEARSAPARGPSLRAADATAKVVGATTQVQDGVFETVVDLEPSACAARSKCPRRAHARVFGGRVGNIVQQVGEQPSPAVDDEVEVAFTGASFDDSSEAVVLAVHSPLSGR